MPELTPQSGFRKHKRLVVKLAFTAVFMFGFAYMLVPLYTLVCQQAGINGQTTNGPDIADPGMKVDTSRTIDVEFSTTIHGPLRFDFKPLIHHVQVHPGEQKLVYFFAKNETGHDITVQAIPSINPNYAAKEFKKTECFCFTQQYFFKDEKADMPVYFYIDPSVDKDVKAMTLSYTLFDATKHINKSQEHFTKGRIELNTKD